MRPFAVQNIINSIYKDKETYISLRKQDLISLVNYIKKLEAENKENKENEAEPTNERKNE